MALDVDRTSWWYAPFLWDYCHVWEECKSQSLWVVFLCKFSETSILVHLRPKLFIPFGLERNCIVDQMFLVVVKWKTQEKWPAQEEICSSIHKNGAKFGASNFPLGNLQALLRFVRFLEKRLILKSLAN